LTLHNLARGRLLAHAIIARVAREAAVVERKLGRKASLAIVAGADVQSRRFVQIKQQLLSGVPIQLAPSWLEPECGTAEALGLIGELNARDDVDGIFLQFPLPHEIAVQMIADALQSEKDIDCSGSGAEAQFERGDSPFTPVAPAAACQLLEDTLGSLAERRVMIWGTEAAFSRALAILLRRKGATIHAQGPGNGEGLRGVAALVVTEELPPSDVWREADDVAVILDAGYYLPPRPSTWLASWPADRSCILLKQYGNVGPLTVANLATAAVRAAARRASHLDRIPG
jgi:methylenetetrahydrofolate dehydrogenase (NADP+)/methenyltetrahydrofolate cyclohydrolase